MGVLQMVGYTKTQSLRQSVHIRTWSHSSVATVGFFRLVCILLSGSPGDRAPVSEMMSWK